MYRTRKCDEMKKLEVGLITVLFIAAVVLSFLAGGSMRGKEYRKERAASFDKYISAAIDTVEGKGVFLEGAAEAIASNLWVAHELCDDPEISAELSNLWNTLVYEKEVFAGREDVVAAQLKGILEKCQ